MLRPQSAALMPCTVHGAHVLRRTSVRTLMRCAPNRIWSGPTRASLLGFALRPIILFLSPSCLLQFYYLTNVNISNAHKEEFSHLPKAFLTIGTFGIYALKEVKQQSLASNNKIGEQDLSDFTSEEVATLVKELENMGLERGNSTQDQFLDCSTSFTDPNSEDYKNVSTESEIVLSKGRDLLDDTNIVLKKRSISFLIKNLFACRGGFMPVPAPELRDPFSQSRMEKLFKSILRKKIYPQNATTMPTKKCLQRKHQEKFTIEEVAAQEKGDDREKWVKTDSEYIVLEI